MSKRYHSSSMNDPDRWAHATCELEPESFMEHEEFTSSFTLPFDICMALCEGNKEQARALHWGVWSKLRGWNAREPSRRNDPDSGSLPA